VTAEPAVTDLQTRTLERWDRLRVRWALLREPAPEDQVADVDLLLHPDDLGRAREAALSEGLALLPGVHRGTHLVGYDEAAGRWVWLHCVTELSYGPWQVLRTGVGEAALERRRPVPHPARLDPADEFWATLLHCLLDHHDVPPRHRERLGSIASAGETASPLAEAVDGRLPPGWSAARIVAAARQGTWDELEELGARWRSRCRSRAPSLPARSASALSRLPARLSGWWLRRGVRVALLGPDGAGKSTLAGGLHSTVPLPMAQVYMGLTGGWLRRVDKLRIPGVVRIGRLLVIWGRYLRGLALAAAGRLVIFDRYIYDAEVPTPYHLGPAARLARWIDGHACPGPDVTILLDAPGDVMFQRKGEYDGATLEHWRQRFLGVRRRVPDLEVVDTTRAADAVLRDVTARIWRRYAERWKAR
jgi:thymidylate kinase